LAQDHVADTTKADQAVQVDDLENDVAIGFQPSQEPNVDHGRTVNLVTMHLGLEETLLAPQRQPNQELQADSSRALNPETIPLDPDSFRTQLLSSTTTRRLMAAGS
jgi:hypothetical protein